MARANVVHSQDACTIIFEGDKRNRLEPSQGIIKFPGGHVEVTRTSDGGYWAHVWVEEQPNESRVDYTRDKWLEHGIPAIVDQEHVRHLAVHVAPKVAP